MVEGIRTAVDVDAVLETVDGGDLALTSLVAAADDHDLVLRKVSTQRQLRRLRSDLHPCGRGCCGHRAFRGAPYSVAPESVRTCPSMMFCNLHTLMMTRRALLGAEKCAFRDLRRELATSDWTLAIVAVCDVVGLVERKACRLVS